jgi:hypothetical protein
MTAGIASTNNADRTATAKNAVDIQHAVACGFCSCARRPGFGKDSRGFCESESYFCVWHFAAAF